MRIQAPSNTALILTSKSIGKRKLKLSASVRTSLVRPPHFFLISPTLCTSSADFTWKEKKKKIRRVKRNVFKIYYITIN